MPWVRGEHDSFNVLFLLVSILFVFWLASLGILRAVLPDPIQAPGMVPQPARR